MSVGIDEAGERDLAFAVDLDDLLSVLLKPGIAKGILALAHRDNLSPEAEDGGVFDDAQFLEFGAAARAGGTGSRPQREQLADVDEKDRVLGWRLGFLGRGHAEQFSSQGRTGRLDLIV